MKTQLNRLAILPLLLLLIAVSTASAISKRDTAEFYLSYATEYLDKDVRLDVLVVQPVHWASSDPEVVFFHALTYDTIDDRFGGHILVMLPATEKEAFLRKFEVNRNGRRTDTLSGVLRLLPGRKEEGKVGGIYVVDYKGLLEERLKANPGALSAEEEMTPGAGMEGGDLDVPKDGGNGRRPPRKNHQ
jgi:hypothetical protein